MCTSSPTPAWNGSTTRAGRSQWEQLKREPKQPNVREVASFLTHIEAVRKLADGLPQPEDVPVSKRTQFVLEARALNVREMMPGSRNRPWYVRRK